METRRKSSNLGKAGRRDSGTAGRRDGGMSGRCAARRQEWLAPSTALHRPAAATARRRSRVCPRPASSCSGSSQRAGPICGARSAQQWSACRVFRRDDRCRRPATLVRTAKAWAIAQGLAHAAAQGKAPVDSVVHLIYSVKQLLGDSRRARFGAAAATHRTQTTHQRLDALPAAQRRQQQWRCDQKGQREQQQWRRRRRRRRRRHGQRRQQQWHDLQQ